MNTYHPLGAARRLIKPQGRSREWTSTHVLLLIITFQAVFMIFMGMHGPSFGSHHNGEPNAGPKHHPKGGKTEWKASKKMNNRNVLQKPTTSKNRGSNQNPKSPDDINKVDAKDAGLDEEKIHVPPKKKTPPKVIQPKKTNPLPTKPPKATSPPQYKEMLQVKEWEVNTKDLPGALHFHFAHERQEPSFRQTLPINRNKWSDAQKEATLKMVKSKQIIKPCQYFHPTDGSLRFMESCFNTEQGNHNGLIAYNAQSFTRIWCGKTIKPGAVQHSHKKEVCNETARVLLESDKMLGIERTDLKHLPPVVFRREGSTAKLESVQDCDVPCQFTMDTCVEPDGKKQKGPACLPDVSDWTVEGTDFRFKYSMMDVRDAPQINIMRKGYRHHQFYATRSFSAEIPLSSFDWEKYGENTPANDFKKAGKKGLCFIHIEPCSGEIRPDVWAAKIKEAFKGKFDAYGPCKFPKLNIKITKQDVYNYKDRQKIMSQYMFTLVIGQSQSPDFVQDMVWDALQAGSIPIYFGAPNIKEHVPPQSIIKGAEFPSQEALAKYLEEIMADQSKWRQYHAWRDEDTVYLEEKYGFLKEKSSSPYCRMCRWATATKYALGWNPVTQSIQTPAVDRTLCVNPKDEVKFPFLEVWMSNLGVQEPKGRKICDKTSATQTMVFDEIALTRTVSTHDNGVIDIEITDIKSIRDKEKIVMRLDFHKDIQNVEGAHILHPHQLMANEKDSSSELIPLMSSIAIQDKKTRVTVLANWPTELLTPNVESTIDILIQDLRKAKEVGEEDPETGFRSRLAKDDVRRVRVIMEDVNLLRDVSTEYSISPYAHLMMKDFLDPLMHFYID